MSRPIYDDPVVAETHAIRKALLDDCDGDITEYRMRTRQRQTASGRRIVRSPLTKCTEPSHSPRPGAGSESSGQPSSPAR